MEPRKAAGPRIKIVSNEADTNIINYILCGTRHHGHQSMVNYNADWIHIKMTHRIAETAELLAQDEYQRQAFTSAVKRAILKSLLWDEMLGGICIAITNNE